MGCKVAKEPAQSFSYTKNNMLKPAKPLGEGSRFAALAAKTSPAIAASVGRKKYGNKKMQEIALQGRAAGLGNVPVSN